MPLDWNVTGPSETRKIQVEGSPYDARKQFSTSVENNQIQMALVYLDQVVDKIADALDRIDDSLMQTDERITRIEDELPAEKPKAKRSTAKKSTTTKGESEAET